ncbi:oligosaccharyl transferase subunit ost3/OST6, partial [Basidiobolus ranarum]
MKAKIVLSVLLCLSLLFICSASNDKIQQLDNLPADSNGVIKLNSASFELLTSGPRNYSAIVVLTALNPAFGCAACGFFEPNYQLISKSWLSTKNSQELYFGQLEVDDGREVFMKLGIQTAPYILFYPPTEGPKAKKQDFILYEISSKGLQAEPLAEFLSQQLGVEVPINRPFDWTKNGLKLLTGVAVIIFIYFVFTKFRTILASNGIWSSISLV